MKCLVCGKYHEAAECPRCRFPEILLMGDQEKAMEHLMPTIRAYRMNLMKSVRIELLTYRWKDKAGVVVEDRRDWMLLGDAEELMQGEKWMSEKFARLADQAQIPVTVRITVKDEAREQTIDLPNLHNPELQQLGAAVDSDYHLRLWLRNDTQSPVSSAPVPLVD